jgi:hypothetical protein
MKIEVRDDTGNNTIYLDAVNQYTNAKDAAHDLWASINNASKIFGGQALIRTPEHGERGYRVRWNEGPKQWADAYVVSDGADGRGFVAEAQSDGMEIRFVDLA